MFRYTPAFPVRPGDKIYRLQWLVPLEHIRHVDLLRPWYQARTGDLRYSYHYYNCTSHSLHCNNTFLYPRFKPQLARWAVLFQAAAASPAATEVARLLCVLVWPLGGTSSRTPGIP
jgi:hypothetical protein